MKNRDIITDAEVKKIKRLSWMLLQVVWKLCGNGEIPSKNFNLPKLTKEGMENLNSPKTIKELKSVDRHLPHRENLRPRWPH